MKNRTRKLMAMVLAATMAVSGLTACGTSASDSESNSTTSESEASSEASSTADAESEDSNTDSTDLSGTIQLDGSTSMQKVAAALQEAFMEKYPNVTVDVQYSGSGTGIANLIAGSVDIGNSSRSLKDEETAEGAVENVIAIDGIAVIVNTANTLTNITSEDLAKVYTGEITNWSELGGEDEPIVVVGREAASGTRSAFEELLEIEDQCQYAQELDSTGSVLSTVVATEGAIGYVSLDVVDDTVVALQLDGVTASEEEIKAGNYSLSRPFVMATMGEISEQSELVQAWFEFVESEEGQQIITDLGLILPD